MVLLIGEARKKSHGPGCPFHQCRCWAGDRHRMMNYGRTSKQTTTSNVIWLEATVFVSFYFNSIFFSWNVSGRCILFLAGGLRRYHKEERPNEKKKAWHNLMLSTTTSIDVSSKIAKSQAIKSLSVSDGMLREDGRRARQYTSIYSTP